MNCPKCNASSKVVASKRMKTCMLKRRRRCNNCGFRWTTYQSSGGIEVLNENIQPNVPAQNNAKWYDGDSDAALDAAVFRCWCWDKE